MANSLQDQLLTSGLATEEQLQQAKDSKKRPKRKPQARKHNNNKKPTNKRPSTPNKPKKPASDLAQFYSQRSSFEKKTRIEEEKKKKEAARLKKLNRKKIRKLLLDNMQNVEDAEVRFNFVVGTNIKYLYVTEEQQEGLGNGTLAITFLGGKRCLISVDLIEKLRELEPSKLIIVPGRDEEISTTDKHG